MCDNTGQKFTSYVYIIFKAWRHQCVVITVEGRGEMVASDREGRLSNRTWEELLQDGGGTDCRVSRTIFFSAWSVNGFESTGVSRGE